MENNNKTMSIWGMLGILIFCTVFTVIAGIHMYWREEIEEAVERIHATKLKLSDVVGNNLPLGPGVQKDTTIEGIDANKNGIRDDVELAIFKQYPDSEKIRAVLLQYALTMQMQMTLSLVNTQTVTATVEDNESRADACLWNLSDRSDLQKFMADMNMYTTFLENLQINTPARKDYVAAMYENLRSYTASHDGCDLDLSILPN